MGTTFNVVSSVFFALGCLVLAGNYWAVYVSGRNRRLGIDKHMSTIPVVTQILAVLGGMASGPAGQPWIPGWAFLLMAVVDPFLWQTVIVLFNRKVLGRRPK
jgi:hypothetical protein